MMDYINFDLNVEQDVIDGTSPAEVYSITFFVPLCSILNSVITRIWFKKYTVLLEAILVNLVLLLSVTLFSSYLTLLLLAVIIPLSINSYMFCHKLTVEQSEAIKKYIFKSQPLEHFNRKFIGDYRGHLLLATSICILAVDFAIFPVRFSKTETYGWSVMDAGVGSFVLMHGLCSPMAKAKRSTQNSFKNCILSSFPLFILGVIRFIVTSAVGYHKVVPEYGMHWNFFFTLSFIKVICYVISTCLPFIISGFLAVLIICFHQILLSTYLTAFILSERRENIIEANKEGICSLLGFVAIYFCGVQLGKFLWKKRFTVIEYVHVFLMLIVIGICGWILMYVIHIYVQPVSRRMANLGYCIWVVSLTSLQIAIHLACHIINFISNFNDSLLWEAINYNGLFYFLNANVITGFVNLTIETKYCEAWLSFLILIVYLIILNISIAILYKKSVCLKFW